MTKRGTMHTEMVMVALQPFVASFGVLFRAAAANQMWPTVLAIVAAFFVGAGGAISGVKGFISTAYADANGDGK